MYLLFRVLVDPIKHKYKKHEFYAIWAELAKARAHSLRVRVGVFTVRERGVGVRGRGVLRRRGVQELTKALACGPRLVELHAACRPDLLQFDHDYPRIRPPPCLLASSGRAAARACACLPPTPHPPTQPPPHTPLGAEADLRAGLPGRGAPWLKGV